MSAANLEPHKCPPPSNKWTRWCGLEGQVLNHIRPLPAAKPAESSMAGRYSPGLWPRSCVNGASSVGHSMGPAYFILIICVCSDLYVCKRATQIKPEDPERVHHWPVHAAGTVAGQWTQATLHAFLVFLDEAEVRRVDVWCSGAAMPCPAIVDSGECTWFTRELAWWKANGR